MNGPFMWEIIFQDPILRPVVRLFSIPFPYASGLIILRNTIMFHYWYPHGAIVLTVVAEMPFTYHVFVVGQVNILFIIK